MIVANREAKDNGGAKEDAQQLTVDPATRIWRGRERLGLQDLIAEGAWPASGKKSLDGQSVYLGIAWKPAGTWERRMGNRLHISDIRRLSWPDDLVPREEYTAGNREERFPSPDIFPKY